MANKIIIALGNPGKEYERTYHNAGVLLMSYELKQKYGTVEFKKYKNIFEYLETEDAVYILPLTFMNDSGKAAKEALKKFRMKPERLVVYQDDSDIPIGDFKISVARSSAGHKGVQSIIDALKTNEFTRVRIGIRPVNEIHRKKAGEFALKKSTTKDSAIFEKVFKEIVSSAESN